MESDLALRSVAVLAAVAAATFYSEDKVHTAEGLPPGTAKRRASRSMPGPAGVPSQVKPKTDDGGGLTTYQRMLQQEGGVGQLTTIQKMVLLADEDNDAGEGSGSGSGGTNRGEPDFEDVEDKCRKFSRMGAANRKKSRLSNVNATQWRAAGQSGYGMADEVEFYQEDEGGKRRGKPQAAAKKDDVEDALGGDGKKETFVVINGLYFNVSDEGHEKTGPTDAQVLMLQLHNSVGSTLRAVTGGQSGGAGNRGQGLDAGVSFDGQAAYFDHDAPVLTLDRKLGHFYDVRYDQELGSGSFSVVRPAIEKSTGAEVAIKFVDRRMSNDEVMYGEVDVMRHLAGGEDDVPAPESILRLRDVFETPQSLCLVLERVDGGPLFDHVLENGEMDERSARHIFEEVLVALNFMHERGVCHSDIKPENLILTQDEAGVPTGVKVCDFGLSRHYDNQGNGLLDSYQTGIMKDGTWAYWAPELLKSESVQPPVDIWAAGIVLYIMLCGAHPFDPEGENNEIQLIQNIAKGTYDQTNEQYKSLSPAAKDLLSKALDPDPKRRLTAAEALSHPWVRAES
jgi:hypothetical protein